MATDCPICADKFNGSTRKRCTCPYCQIDYCRECVGTWLTSLVDEPRCPTDTCKKQWNREYLDTIMTKVWRDSIYREYRETLLFDRERALLPATQPRIEAINEAGRVERELIIPMRDRRKNIHVEIAKLHAEEQALNTQVWDLQHQAERLRQGVGVDEAAKKRATFVRRCPSEGCRGFLSSAWKCGVCDLYSCSDCHEVKGVARDSAHTCDPGNVETAKLLAKDTKACPKCGEMIEKKEGCDQMFCISCHTAFSWKTLEIVKGAIHNPHYFAWRQNQGVNERTIGDIQCGGVPDQSLFNFYSDLRHQYYFSFHDADAKDLYDEIETTGTRQYRAERMENGRRTYQASTIITMTKYHKMNVVFSHICRHLEHMRSYTQQYGAFYYNEDDRTIKLRHMRLNYLRDFMSKEDFKVYLSAEEKKREKLSILAQPIDTLYNAGADILRRAIPSVSNVGVDMSIAANKTPENYEKLFAYGKQHIDEYNKLIEFINDIYNDISIEFNVKVPNITKYCTEDMINYSKTAREGRREERRKAAAVVRTVAEHDSDSDY